MAHRVFTINSAEDWAKCADWIAQYARRSEQKMHECVHSIARFGENEASKSYASVTGNEAAWIASTPGTSVSINKESRTREDVVASGTDVMFAEFGAGSMTDVTHPYAPKMPFAVAPGSYSDTHGGRYSTNIASGGNHDGQHYWRYAKKRWVAVEPARGMYNAFRRMEYEAPGIIRQVFGRRW